MRIKINKFPHDYVLYSIVPHNAKQDSYVYRYCAPFGFSQIHLIPEAHVRIFAELSPSQRNYFLDFFKIETDGTRSGIFQHRMTVEDFLRRIATNVAANTTEGIQYLAEDMPPKPPAELPRKKNNKPKHNKE